MKLTLVWRCKDCGNITPRHPDTAVTDMGSCPRHPYGHKPNWEATSLEEVWAERSAQHAARKRVIGRD